METLKSKAIGIDENRIKQDAMWDGYYGIETSQKITDEHFIVNTLHKLWKIEESIRLLKSTMRTEPIFVWTPKRIIGHFVICFIALVLERALEIRLKANKINCSPEQIQQAIRNRNKK